LSKNQNVFYTGTGNRDRYETKTVYIGEKDLAAATGLSIEEIKFLSTQKK
jgi:hypothetical protein